MMPIFKATAAQRRNLPDAAFAAVFKTAEKMERRVLPHHINTVKAGADNGTVDVSRLRNALAMFGQLKGVPSAVKAKAMAHIQAHADAILKGRKVTKESMGSIDPLDRLQACLMDIYAGRATAHHYAIDDIEEPTAEELLWSEEMQVLELSTEALHLLEGQSISDLSRVLGDAVRAGWAETVGEEGYAYLEAVYDDYLVAYARPEGAASAYWKHAWAQADDGTVALGMPAKVLPRTVYDLVT